MLDRVQILEAAGELISGSGLGSLSIRSLSFKLDCNPIDLHGWYTCAHDIALDVLDHELSLVHPTGEGPWDERLADYLCDVADLLSDGLYELVGLWAAAGAGVGAAHLRHADNVVRLLGEGGYEGEVAVCLLFATHAMLLGWLLMSEGGDAALDEDPTIRSRRASAARALPTYPAFNSLRLHLNVVDAPPYRR